MNYPQFLVHESGNSTVKLISERCYILVTIFKEYKKEDYYHYQVRHDAQKEVFDLVLDSKWKCTTENNFELARKELFAYLDQVRQAIRSKSNF